MAWLSPDVEMLSRFAARVKLRSTATVRNADRTLSSSRTTIHSPSTALAHFAAYSNVLTDDTLILE
jgi:hypothetical protein